MSKYTPVNVETARPEDLYTIAALESRVFFDDPWSIVAFGPDRTGPEKTQHRAERLAKLARKKGETARVIKATLNSEIVGSAVFIVVTNRKEGGDELREEVVEGEKMKGESEEGEGEKEMEAGRWGPGANLRFCEEVFLKGDAYMMAACGEDDYAKLGSLVVSENHQRMGIGSQLLERFLEETDEMGLQAVLGASKFGRGLYKKYGFRDYIVESLVMSQYERGQGMEDDEQVIMHRLARPVESEDVQERGTLRVRNGTGEDVNE